ncbi:DUF4302 domain-containing protein [Sphingobacterium alkalisoli]|uniref:DUF4302 domain-containing protein n=1 Tax=Sphingobacterium alkalisoli TaxID=1874115 RepID=A0A4V5LXX4_9SPHI|nr:DUF4302 domain-containing protein [Sphingobacterium alkalisoli]TJY64279.1 DUF4302 domain-containing protein [Sphingobacterium alkalisoli]GGH22736.1 hypothetical protein GCM10011418_29490 [Sphingobacterium alkalisoli]
MKTKLLLSFIVFAFISCQKDSLTQIEVEDVYGDPEEKLQPFAEEISNYEGGWEFIVLGRNNSQSYGYIEFNTNSIADFISTVNTDFIEPDTTSYKITVHKANPSLIFPSSSNFASLAQLAGGLDTLFTFKNVENDTIFLEGEYQKSRLKLYKSKSTTSINEKVENLLNVDSLLTMPKFFYNISLNNSTEVFAYVDEENQAVVFHYKEGGVSNYHFTKFLNTVDGIKFENPLTLNGISITFEDLKPATSSSFTFRDGQITNAAEPAFYENAINDFLISNSINESQVWLSEYSWSRRKRLDAFNMKAIRSDMQSVFNYRNFNTQAYHQICVAWFPGFFWYSGALAINHTVTTGNLLRFTYLGAFAAASRADVTAYMTSMVNRYIVTSGHYVFKTYNNRIAVVSADNAENWIFFH